MAKHIFFSGGYPRPYQNDAQEVASAKKQGGFWFPASIDFQATAVASGGGESVSTFDEMIQKIGAKPKGSIEELGVIGHANSVVFALGGTIKTGPTDADVFFDKAAAHIGAAEIQSRSAAISAVRDRFAPGAKIVMYGCHLATSDNVLQELSKAFGVCAAGFSEKLIYCFEWNSANSKITARGKVYFDKTGLFGAGLMGCSGFSPDVRTLKPDKESCAGVAAGAGAAR